MALTYSEPFKVADAITSAATPAVANASTYYEHTFGVAVTGTATVTIQWSPDNSAWFPAADAVTLTNDSDSVFLVGAFPYLRADVAIPSSATVTVWCTQFGDDQRRGR